jgi:mono/diheme cytochrome c family protein
MLRRILAGVLLVVALVLLAIRLQGVQAIDLTAQDSVNIVRGAMLYDKWYAVLGQDAPQANMPLWAKQTTNTRSGSDTWRCVSCHGWDYQGREGAYRYGSNYTGFPGIYSMRDQEPGAIIAVLKGANNPEHDFSAYLDDASLNELALFINQALIDDNEFIDPQTLEVKSGDTAHGKELYNQSCASCHGEDGKKIVFRFEGRNAWLGTLATLDPWRFLHKTRFGTPGTEMTIGQDLGWTAQDGRDVLLHARSLPNGLEIQGQAPSMEGREGEIVAQPGGPAGSVLSGMLTALGAVATGLGFSLMIGVLLGGVILLVVWLVRGQKK